MKIFTPSISWHDRQPILSVDIQNRLHSMNNSFKYYRLATGGNDNHVHIWKISIKNRNVENNDDVKCKPSDLIECLAELTQHQRSVNVVRFSPNLNDNLLASGDDDSLIYIWKYCCDEEKSSNNEQLNMNQSTVDNMTESDIISIEVWRTCKILRGHSLDVFDLCWSSDGQFLVSGSVDNNVFVWDVNRGTKVHKVMKEHNSYVQGVTWDPLNKYIASLSADRQMIIFNSKNGKTLHKVFKMYNFENNENNSTNINLNNTHDDKMVTDNNNNSKSTRLFYDQTFMSFFRRLTFSPGGELLFAPSGIIEHENDRFHNVVHVFERKSLNRPSFYLSTGKLSIAVKCCPIVFKLRNNQKNNLFNLPYRIVFAVATEDSILLYDSQQATPFGYVSSIHYLRLTDLSWSYDGRFLIITSNDGFSSFIIFDEQELGEPYEGKLMDFEEIDSSNLNPKNSNKINLSSSTANVNSDNNTSGSPNRKTPSKQSKPICSTPITEYFRKSSPSSKIVPSNKNNQSQLSLSSQKQINQSNNAKAGRRIQFITLQTPNNNKSFDQSNNNNNDNLQQQPQQQQSTLKVNDNEPKFTVGMKRKQLDNENLIDKS